MALRVAVANGNWSNPAIWNGGVLPSNEDIIASNTYTVNIDQNFTCVLLTNRAYNAVSETESMTSNTTPSGIASSNDEGYGTFAWQAFANNVYQGGDVSGRWITLGSASVSTPKWLEYQFPTPKVIVFYELRYNSASTGSIDPRDWTFEAWNGSTWVVLDTRTNQTHSTINVGYNVTNSTAYSRYRINITSAVNPGSNVEVYEFRMFTTTLLQSAVAGGGFILNSGVTVTTTGSIGLFPGSNDLVTFNTLGTASVLCGNGIIYRPDSNNTAAAIRLSGGGNLSVTGRIFPLSSSSYSRGIYVSSVTGATLNFTGSSQAAFSFGVVCDVNCTLNYIGDVYGFTNNGPAGGIHFTGGGTLNFTGNAYGSTGYNNDSAGIHISAGQLNFTGNAYGSTSNQGGGAKGVTVAGNININFTGNIYGGTSTVGLGHYGLATSNNIVMTHIGGIYGAIWAGLNSTSASAIILTTGPFVSDTYGGFPFLVTRMHLIPTSNSYLEFRNSTTNGAFSPSPAAPAARFLSPATAVDAPIPANVRLGIVYALGTLTGTLAMPHPNQVTYGIPVDATSGNAVLTAASVWDYLVSNITTADSIGMRLKNVATPQTTGEQLEAFLRLD